MSNRNQMGPVGAAVSVVLLILFIGGAFWIRASAPCSWYSLTSAKDVPARCLMHR